MCQEESVETRSQSGRQILRKTAPDRAKKEVADTVSALQKVIVKSVGLLEQDVNICFTPFPGRRAPRGRLKTYFKPVPNVAGSFRREQHFTFLISLQASCCMGVCRRADIGNLSGII